jgi:DNA-directed RNA polymerase sigma subunit (sigma70/sigma32)
MDPRDPDAEFSDTVVTRIAVQQVVNALPYHERIVVSEYYALDGGEPKTLRQTSDRVGRSHESVRQMLQRAQKSMRLSLQGCA